MANDATDTFAAIHAAAAAISSTDPRFTLPEEQRRWKSWWSGLWCFGSPKRDKRIVPATRLDGTNGMNGSSRGWITAGPGQAGLALAPPSSPASFVNSSVQSPALSAESANVCSPSPTNPMFRIGPYAYEPQLVSPPVFSTFNTEPSTAPITPPSELAHLTTPSSPEVPFALLLASSLEAKTAAIRGTFSPFSSSPLTSPGEASAGDLQCAYQLYPGSPVSHLVSPTSGYCRTGTASPVTDIEFPAHLSTSLSAPVSSFPNFQSFNYGNVELTHSATLLLSPKSEESKHNWLRSESSVSRRGPDLSIDLCNDVAVMGEAGRNMPFMESPSCHTLPNGTHFTEASMFKYGDMLGKPVRDEEKLDGFSLNRITENNLNIFHVVSRDNDSRKPESLQDFHTTVVGAALAKRENIGAYNWMQMTDCIVEENQSLPIVDFPVVNMQGCRNLEPMENVSPQTEVNRTFLPNDHFTCRTTQEVSDDFCMDFQESLRSQDALPTLSQDATSLNFDFKSNQKDVHEQLRNGSKVCVYDS